MFLYCSNSSKQVCVTRAKLSRTAQNHREMGWKRQKTHWSQFILLIIQCCWVILMNTTTHSLHAQGLVLLLRWGYKPPKPADWNKPVCHESHSVQPLDGEIKRLNHRAGTSIRKWLTPFPPVCSSARCLSGIQTETYGMCVKSRLCWTQNALPTGRRRVLLPAFLSKDDKAHGCTRPRPRS